VADGAGGPSLTPRHARAGRVPRQAGRCHGEACGRACTLCGACLPLRRPAPRAKRRPVTTAPTQVRTRFFDEFVRDAVLNRGILQELRPLERPRHAAPRAAPPCVTPLHRSRACSEWEKRVSEWPPQIVMIGAGFDARALRAVDLRWDLAPKVAPSHRLAAVKGGNED